MSAADRIYPLLLRMYPRAWVAVHGGELLATLESSSGGRVLLREVVGLLTGGLRQRRLEDQWRPRRATVESAMWLAVLLLLGAGLAFDVSLMMGSLLVGPEGWSGERFTEAAAQQLAMVLLWLSQFALVLRGRPGMAIALTPALILLPYTSSVFVPHIFWLGGPAVAGAVWLVVRRGTET